MKRTIIAISTLFAFNAYAEDMSLSSIMAISKATGACGIMKQMASFQETTKMSGGDQFMLRFWQTEAARLGTDLSQYIKTCEKVTGAYTEMYELSEKIESDASKP